MQTLQAEVDDIATGLQSRVRELLGRVATSGVTQTELAQSLGLELNLVSRIYRGVDAPDAIDGLQTFPGPQGLRLFVDAAARKDGVDELSTGPARQAIARYETYADAFPGGRTALATVAAGWGEQTRLKAARAASQQAFRGMSQLLTCRADALGVTSVFVPSRGREGAFDEVRAICAAGLRRYQSRSAIKIAECQIEGGVDWKTVHGQPFSCNNSAEGVIAEGSTPKVGAAVSVIPTATSVRVMLGAERPSLDESVDLTVAMARRGVPFEHPVWHGRSLHNALPAKLVIFDLLVHKSLGETRFDHPYMDTAACSKRRPGDGSIPHESEGLTLDISLSHGAVSKRTLRHRALPRFAEAIATLVGSRRLDLGEFMLTRLLAPYHPVGLRTTLYRRV